MSGTLTVPCKRCRGRGMVRYGKVREGFNHTYLEVARECPDCDGRGELQVRQCPVDSLAAMPMPAGQGASR